MFVRGHGLLRPAYFLILATLLAGLMSFVAARPSGKDALPR